MIEIEEIVIKQEKSNFILHLNGSSYSINEKDFQELIEFEGIPLVNILNKKGYKKIIKEMSDYKIPLFKLSKAFQNYSKTLNN